MRSPGCSTKPMSKSHFVSFFMGLWNLPKFNFDRGAGKNEISSFPIFSVLICLICTKIGMHIPWITTKITFSKFYLLPLYILFKRFGGLENFWIYRSTMYSLFCGALLLCRVHTMLCTSSVVCQDRRLRQLYCTSVTAACASVYSKRVCACTGWAYYLLCEAGVPRCIGATCSLPLWASRGGTRVLLRLLISVYLISASVLVCINYQFIANIHGLQNGSWSIRCHSLVSSLLLMQNVYLFRFQIFFWYKC